MEPGKLLYGRVDTASTLAAAVAHINAMRPRPDVVLATGDLVNAGRVAQYGLLGEILSDLAVPVLPIPGNHDDRTALRAAFDTLPPGGPHDPIDYVVDGHPLRLLGLDTSIPGRHDGELTPAQLSWLDERLSSAPTTPTLVFQHHPPFATGIAWMDRSGLSGRKEEAAIIAAHPQVCAIVCGHIHRPISALVGGAVATTWPSTGAQVALALDDVEHEYVDEPPAVALHRWSEPDGLVSHTSYVATMDRWVPPWARGDLSFD